MKCSKCGEGMYNVTEIGDTTAKYICACGHRSQLDIVRGPGVTRLIDEASNGEAPQIFERRDEKERGPYNRG